MGTITIAPDWWVLMLSDGVSFSPLSDCPTHTVHLPSTPTPCSFQNSVAPALSLAFAHAIPSAQSSCHTSLFASSSSKSHLHLPPGSSAGLDRSGLPLSAPTAPNTLYHQSLIAWWLLVVCLFHWTMSHFTLIAPRPSWQVI